MKKEGIDFPKLPEFSEFKGTLFRSFRTRIESINLHKNLGVEDQELPILHQLIEEGNYGADSDLTRLRSWEYQSKEIFPGIVLEGLSRFGAENYRYGRASYYSMEETTSLFEVTYHDRKNDIMDSFRNNPNTQMITIDRFMYRIDVRSVRVADFRHLQTDFQGQLILEDYSFCQKLGDSARDAGAEMIFAPSARKLGGTCAPILSESLLKSATEEKICFFQTQFFRDGSLITSRLGESFIPPTEWGTWTIK